MFFGIDLITFLAICFIFIGVLIVGWRSTDVPDYHPGSVTQPAVVATVVNGPIPVRRVSVLDRLVSQITYGSLGTLRARHPLQVNNPHGQAGRTDNVFLLWNEDNERLRRQTEYIIESIENENQMGPEAIIREMDRDNSTENGGVGGGASPAATNTSSASSSSTAVEGESPRREELENCANENSENANKQADPLVAPTEAVEVPDEEAWTIKIKYLNDDLKLVEGRPSQTIGDFKRKHFTLELAADKLVRLVFNGQVLQPDSRTLRNCGLFENCVVHCLIHIRDRASSRSPQSTDARQGSHYQATPDGATNNQLTDNVTNVNSSNQVGQNGNNSVNGNGAATASAIERARNHVENMITSLFQLLVQWRYFKQLLIGYCIVLMAMARIIFADLFTPIATSGLVLVSLMLVGIGLTVDLM